ncbi:hypothetical protein [Yinghuangia soli]|uniref:Uncharacterized protein n=1 Tax=Yinghuangia soli TaxID=2908204 RepID=A0AA41U3X7_9ACTN|nr:hypothetical protein [Yinghuangia soli]MCF2533188.1 hypothetical protein [Yinghuangia soli]
MAGRTGGTAATRTCGDGSEFTGRSDAPFEPRSTVDFWTYIVEGETVTAFTTPHLPDATTAEEAVHYLRMLALERILGRRVDDEQLVQAGLVALVLDVEAPTLPTLAGLRVREQRQAVGLFEQVLDELGITPELPADHTEIRWELVRWWLRLIANGSMAPLAGGEVMAYDGWAALGEVVALGPLAELVRDPAYVPADKRLPPAERNRAIIAEAERLLAGAWPPSEPYSG